MKATLALLAAAEGADVLTTWYGIGHGAHEASPTSAAIIAVSGLAVWAAYKLLQVVAASLIAAGLTGKFRAVFLAGIRVGALMLCGVVASNLLVIL